MIQRCQLQISSAHGFGFPFKISNSLKSVFKNMKTLHCKISIESCVDNGNLQFLCNRLNSFYTWQSFISHIFIVFNFVVISFLQTLSWHRKSIVEKEYCHLLWCLRITEVTYLEFYIRFFLVFAVKIRFNNLILKKQQSLLLLFMQIELSLICTK